MRNATPFGPIRPRPRRRPALRLVAACALLGATLAAQAQTQNLNCDSAAFDGGIGTELDPFQVATPQQLDNLRGCIDNGPTGILYVEQTADLDLTGWDWIPLGTSDTNHLTEAVYDGRGFEISNLSIDAGSFPNTFPDGDAFKFTAVGLFGYAEDMRFTNVQLRDVDVLYDISDRSLTPVGGLVGNFRRDRTTPVAAGIFNSSITGQVEGLQRVGGFVGAMEGFQESRIFQSRSEVAVTAAGGTGGSLVGFADNVFIEQSFATGLVTCTESACGGVGGLVGSLDGRIEDSYATGDLATPDDATQLGGLVGVSNPHTLNRVYSIGGSTTDVPSDVQDFGQFGVFGSIGGLVGREFNSSSSTTIESFWDTEASGWDLSVVGTGKTTAEMTTQSTFSNWNFDTVWAIDSALNDGYPYLQWQTFPATVPGVPTGVTATARDAGADVRWTAPADDGGSAITGYTATSSPAGQTCTTTDTDTDPTQCSVTGLTNGTTYTFTVAATNGVGTGPDSDPSNEVTPATVPGAPTAMTATAGNAEASVSWTAPDDGGSAIAEYLVTSSPDDQNCITTGATECTVPGLTNGTTYTFTVIAGNAEGTGPESAPSNAVTPAPPTTVPGAPTAVTATAGNAEVSVSWTAPADDGGSPITGYTVTSSPDGQTCTTTGATSCTVTGLTNGTTYTFTVIAENDRGDSSPSSPSAEVTPVGPPGAPLQVAVEPGERSLTVSWVAPLNDGGSQIERYRAQANPTCEVAARVDEVAGETAYACTIGNLDPTREYTVTVTAINGAGAGDEAAAGTAARPGRALPIPVFSNWALASLMLAMLAMAALALLRRQRI